MSNWFTRMNEAVTAARRHARDLSTLTDSERLHWAVYARPSASARHLAEEYDGHFANRLDSARDELAFIDAVIASGGKLPIQAPLIIPLETARAALAKARGKSHDL